MNNLVKLLKNQDSQVHFMNLNKDINTYYVQSTEILAKKRLAQKYLTSIEMLQTQYIDSLIFNHKSSMVSKFKDHLIYDDIIEYLKKYLILITFY